MKIVTPKQMSQIDSACINAIGIPGIVLMENAALRVVDEVTGIIGQVRSRNITVIAGKGNNGGDALAVARHLFNKGAKVNVYITCQKAAIQGDAGINLNILVKMGVEVVELVQESQLVFLQNDLLVSELVIDGIFGTGLRGEVRGVAQGVIDSINNSGKLVISIDIPSGVDGETGKIHGRCITAHKTVTFGFAKTGLLLHPGCRHAGELVVADIGIPGRVIDGFDVRTNLIDKEMVSKLVPLRFSDSHKGDYGKVFIITGSNGMTGSGCLTARAALRTGAGLVYLGVPSRLADIYDSSVMEPVTIPLEDKGTGYLLKECIREIQQIIKQKDVIAIGPGLSVSQDIFEIVADVISSSQVPLILDADALNVLSEDVSLLKRLRAKAVITPHPAEMARLMGVKVREVQENRMEASLEFAARWEVITVLKGAKTIVAAPDRSVYINTTGNSGMATGGSGDVLTGVIAGLIGQGLQPAEAAVAGVYIHGVAGDCAANEKGEHGMVAGDIIDHLPYVIKHMKTENSYLGDWLLVIWSIIYWQ